jgi:hypothetical protein
VRSGEDDGKGFDLDDAIRRVGHWGMRTEN